MLYKQRLRCWDTFEVTGKIRKTDFFTASCPRVSYGEEYNQQITTNHYKFTGKERDSESGLDYFGARYYGSGLGRFITPDWAAKATAVPYADFADPQSLNLYTYVRNLPTSRADLDGHDVQLANSENEKRQESYIRITAHMTKDEKGLFSLKQGK